MENFFKSSGVNVHEILDFIDVGIWVLEYSKEKNIYRFRGNGTLARMMGLTRKSAEKMQPDQWYEYWRKRIDPNYLDSIKNMIENMIFTFDNKIDTHMAEKVCYIWNHDLKGPVDIYCGGKVIEKKDDVYKICGYQQDCTNILKLNNCTDNKDKSLNLKKTNNLEEYYKKLAYMDELTGVVNRRSFFYKIKSIMKNRMKRSSDNLWLAMMDLDFFKNINDTFGHLSGDKILKYIGTMLKNLEKQNDRIYVFRYGGEEFIILLYQYSFNEVEKILNSLRKNVKNANILIEEEKYVHITCSIGVTCLKRKKDEKLQNLIYDAIKRADIALYKAKNNGRNRIDFEI